MNTIAKGPGVWITGPSRSGTSMVAGLFAAHGVFFGRTVEGDEHNRKGYYEHPEIVSRVESRVWANWPEAWWKTLAAEGYENADWWGVKRGPNAWPWIMELNPELIVSCSRPFGQIVRSRRRRWGPLDRTAQHERTIRRAQVQIRNIKKKTNIPVVTVNTDAIVKGDYQRVGKVFAKFGLFFSTDIADSWIERDLWNGGKR